MMHQYFILSLLLFSLMPTSYGQVTGSLTGQVINEESGKGLPFATLTLKIVDSVYQSTKTDFDGNYTFSSLALNTYDVEVSYIGFSGRKIEGVLIKTGQVSRLNLEMKEALIFYNFQEILVEAEGIPLIDVDVTCGSLTIEDIDNVRMRSINSISVPSVTQADEGKSLSRNGSVRYTSNTTLINGSISQSSRSSQLKRRKHLSRPKLNPFTRSANGINSLKKTSKEEYGTFVENKYIVVKEEALSTFSIDVDRASYSNIRRHVDQMQMPPKDAVRIEEMVNYFNYDYPQPTDEHPFLVETEVSDCPWNTAAKLMHIGLQGKKIDLENAPISNLVFLIDVSGSMSAANKLPLLKESLKLLISNMRAKDKMAIVVYAGAAGLIQASTSDKTKLLVALDQLEAGGSTAGGAGIELAYKVAKENLVLNGNNRIIIATDGDFNVGNSSATDLEALIVEKRKDAIFLTVLGYGMGNYKDDRMEVLADKGNGNYAYIDNIKEAKKNLVKEMGGTLYTIAKDVKLQIEFNPVQVQSYRLVGYENRLLNKADFNDDSKDAGELGAGHTVTALYEVILSDNYKESKKGKRKKNVDDLVYPKSKVTHLAQTSKDLMTIKLRYKQPKGRKSVLMALPVAKDIQPIREASENFRFASAVAGFGMLLRASEFTKDWTYDGVLELAKGAQGADKEGYRKEFVELVEKVRSMSVEANKIETGK